MSKFDKSLRTAKALKIRRAGRKAEQEFFGPGGPLDPRHPPLRRKTRASENPKRELDVFQKHMIAIAKKTLQMPDAMVGVIGGPSKEEARETLKRFGIRYQENPITVIGAIGNPKGDWFRLHCQHKGCEYYRSVKGTLQRAKTMAQVHSDLLRHPVKITKSIRSNPPKEFCAGIEGTIYNVVKEIRAEKTKYLPGLYKHPFSKRSKVKMLALDTGDILIHSQAGENLWKRD